MKLLNLLGMTKTPIVFAIGPCVDFLRMHFFFRSVGIFDHGIVVTENNFAFFTKQFNLNRFVATVIIHTVKTVLNTVFIRNESFGAVFDINYTVSAVSRRTGNTFHFAANQPIHEIYGMNSLIDNDSSAFFIPRAFPIAFLVVTVGTRPSKYGRCGNYLAELSRGIGIFTNTADSL